MKTAEDFNKKYAGYIERGFIGLEFSNERAVAYLDNVFQDFIKIPGFEFSQIKLKFGMCRFYSNLGLELGLTIEDKINKILSEQKG